MQHWLDLARSGDFGTEREVTSGRELFRAGEAASHACLLVDGAAECTRSTPERGSYVVRIVVAPALLGFAEICAGEPEFLESIRVLGAARVHFIEDGQLCHVLRTNAEAALATLGASCRMLCRTTTVLAGRLHDTEAMLASLVLAYGELFGRAAKEGVVVTLRRTQRELARSVGASERQVQRIMKSWTKLGICERIAGQTLIRDHGALRKRAGELAATLLCSAQASSSARGRATPSLSF